MIETVTEVGVSSPADLEYEPPSQEKLHLLRQGNIEKIQALARFNKGVSPAEAQAILFQTFLDTFLGDEDRLALDINFEHRMSVLLEAAVSNANRQQLLDGVNTNSPDVKSLLQGK